MHAILKKYTVHLHPIQVNKILISKQSEDFIKKFFPNSLLIEYDTPGINVCNKIMSVYNNEEIIFLKNHGIIITTNDYDTLIPTLESLLNIFETNLQINVDKYKYVNQISKYVNKNYENVSYLCEDKIINQYLHDKRQLFQEKITFPDALIFCGVKVLFIDYLQDIENYFDIYKEYPKVIVINDLVYIINISLQKCKDTEDVLKGNLMILDNDMEKTYLTNEEICYLNNWDAEKYRKTI
jgi:rhamnose utilization protein RhaD (predicted bifunctional aldolase and dehydrogenase)